MPLLVWSIRTVLKLFLILFEVLTRKSVFVNHSKIPYLVIKINNYKNIFCGYYDVSPFCPNNSNLLIVHATNYSVYESPGTDKEIDILLYEIKEKKYTILGKTAAWNWQQGARCQWLDGASIAYNKIVDGEVRAVVKNINSRDSLILPTNLNIAYKDKYIISIDYPALTFGSEYGYPKLQYEDNSHEIKLYDLASGAVENLFSWLDLMELNLPNAKKCHINHILPTPDGNSFVFIYRYWVENLRYDSLIHYQISTGNLNVIIKNQTVSHYTMQNNNIIFAWLIIDGVAGYYFVDLEKKIVALTLKIDDGHPNYLGGSNFITDVNTGSRWRGDKLTVIIIDAISSKKTSLISVNHPTMFDYAKRCDVHLSLSQDKKRFQIDSMHIPGKRVVIVGDLL